MVAKAHRLLDPGSVDNELVQSLITIDSEMGADRLLNQLKAGTERNDLAASLAKANVNISFVYSEDDPLMNQQWILAFVQNNPQRSIIPAPVSGIALPFEKTEELLELLFCAQQQ